jgi:hypothetical protein
MRTGVHFARKRYKKPGMTAISLGSEELLDHREDTRDVLGT